MRIKLHWKLILVFGVIIMPAILAGYFYSIAHLKPYIENNLRHNVKRQLFLGRDFLEASLKDKSSSVDLQDFASSMGRTLNLRVTVIASDGRVLGDTDITRGELATLENHAGRPEVKDAFSKGFGESRRFSYTVKKNMLYMALPFSQGGEKGVLRFAVALSEIEALQARMRRIVGVGAVGMLVLSLLLTLVVSISVSRPLTEMAAIARAMAGGDFSRKAPAYSQDEIGQLAQSLNSMSEEIKDKIDKMNSEKARLGLILSSMFEGVIVINESEEIILMNPSLRKLLLVDSDPCGQKLLEVVRNIAIKDLADNILKDKHRLATKEISIGIPEEKIFRVNGVPIVRGERLEGAILVFHDITELRRLEKVRQDFVANVSHELRTPIASIKGYAETLLEGALDDKENAREFVSIIYQNSNRLATLINDLLDLSKIESGKLKLSLTPLDPLALIRRAATVIENQAQAKSITLNFDLPAALPRIKADETRFSQVIINLLDNAIKYTPEGGAVFISARPAHDSLEVAVRDTGIGISEKDLPRIFERFYRVDKARSRELGGTGLGLSIVKHIVQAHGGQVWVKSELEQGSTFSFTIPLA